MLSFLAKYRRMQLDHPVLGEKHLMELIVTYLETEDWAIVVQVCFLWRELVFDDPYRETAILKHNLRQTGQQLEVTLTQAYRKRYGQLPSDRPAAVAHRPPLVCIRQRPDLAYGIMFKAMRKHKQTSRPERPQEDIVAAFRSFAQEEGFRVHKRSDFASDLEYRLYQHSFQTCYHRFVQARKEGRTFAVEAPLRRLPEHYEAPKSSVTSAWETLRQGAQYVWGEIRDEQDWARLPPPNKIRDHIISTFPGVALVHYYWKSRQQPNNASRYTCLMASLYLSMFLTVSLVSISTVSGSLVNGQSPSVSLSACTQV